MPCSPRLQGGGEERACASAGKVEECGFEAEAHGRVSRKEGRNGRNGWDGEGVDVGTQMGQAVLIVGNVVGAESAEDGAFAYAEAPGVGRVEDFDEEGLLLGHYLARCARGLAEVQRAGGELGLEHQPGNLGNWSKSGSRFSRKAFFPSWASAMR